LLSDTDTRWFDESSVGPIPLDECLEVSVTATVTANSSFPSSNAPAIAPLSSEIRSPVPIGPSKATEPSPPKQAWSKTPVNQLLKSTVPGPAAANNSKVVADHSLNPNVAPIRPERKDIDSNSKSTGAWATSGQSAARPGISSESAGRGGDLSSPGLTAQEAGASAVTEVLHHPRTTNENTLDIRKRLAFVGFTYKGVQGVTNRFESRRNAQLQQAADATTRRDSAESQRQTQSTRSRSQSM
jgi:hypothetical protein